VNVAYLPGILKECLGMLDVRWGYGIPMGEIAAPDWDEGVISPGGVRDDISRGVRWFDSGSILSDIDAQRLTLVASLLTVIPIGVGVTGALKLSAAEARQLMFQGARQAVSQGLGVPEGLDQMQEHSRLVAADMTMEGAKQT
jgi:tRNA-splicing ligase RtcB